MTKPESGQGVEAELRSILPYLPPSSKRALADFSESFADGEPKMGEIARLLRIMADEEEAA